MTQYTVMVFTRVLAGTAVLVGLLSTHSADAQQTGDVLLWNTLDSVYEVEHSRVGPNGAVVGGSYGFEPGEFGNGYVRKSTGSNYIRFPNTVLEQVRRRGTAALWVNPKVQHPEPYNYGIFGLINGAYTSNGSIGLMWGDTVTGGNDLNGSTLFGTTGASANSYGFPRFAATPGTPFQAALVWDIDGIDGTTDTVRVYRDGILITRTSDKWNPNGALRPDFILGASPDGNGFDKFIVDNLVLYNYAKTDFSDRFQEDPLGNPDKLDVHSFRYTLGKGSAQPAAAGSAGPAGTGISMTAQFTLDALSDGIDPPTEGVSLRAGTWTLAIPPGSFVTRGACFDFEGSIDGQHVFFKFHETAANSYRVRMKVDGTGVNTLTDPTPLNFRVGDDGATVSVDLSGQINGVAIAPEASDPQ